jgi:hypothetical protein
MAVDVAQEVLRVLRGERPKWAVNPEVFSNSSGDTSNKGNRGKRGRVKEG